MMLKQLFLSSSTVAFCTRTASCPLTYKANSVQFSNVGVESQSLGDPAHFLGYILSIARLGAIDDEGTARLLQGRHGIGLR